MKNVIYILGLSLFLMSACEKREKERFTYKAIGYIYNANDSTPFVNTEFKKYAEDRSPISPTKIYETPFFTDANGRFDFDADHTGKLVWPSFYEGAAYTGPRYFGNGVREERDNDAGLLTTYYDTLYTTPYR